MTFSPFFALFVNSVLAEQKDPSNQTRNHVLCEHHFRRHGSHGHWNPRCCSHCHGFGPRLHRHLLPHRIQHHSGGSGVYAIFSLASVFALVLVWWGLGFAGRAGRTLDICQSLLLDESSLSLAEHIATMVVAWLNGCNFRFDSTRDSLTQSNQKHQVETQMAAWEASLKLCGQQCWTSLFSVPPTDKDVLAFCLNNATAQFNSCAQQACSTDDFSYCQAVVSIIPSTCEIYGITASTFENAGSFAAPSPVFVSATASAAAGAVGAGGSAVNTTSKSGVVGPVCVGVASLVAALLVI
ncbi:hypothetical protein BC830DRAFT_768040 [Chytriomyces sp. MP71]|nr:hypothetical protein BC830DRAFT_768040 [Chytriomyces sp. MP71]